MSAETPVWTCEGCEVIEYMSVKGALMHLAAHLGQQRPAEQTAATRDCLGGNVGRAEGPIKYVQFSDSVGMRVVVDDAPKAPKSAALQLVRATMPPVDDIWYDHCQRLESLIDAEQKAHRGEAERTAHLHAENDAFRDAYWEARVKEARAERNDLLARANAAEAREAEAKHFHERDVKIGQRIRDERDRIQGALTEIINAWDARFEAWGEKQPDQPFYTRLVSAIEAARDKAEAAAKGE